MMTENGVSLVQDLMSVRIRGSTVYMYFTLVPRTRQPPMTRDCPADVHSQQAPSNVNITPTTATASQQAKAQYGIAIHNSEAPQTQQCYAHAQ
jgi:hypothetical protein